MCEPISLSTALALGTAAMSAAGAAYSYKSQSDAASAQRSANDQAISAQNSAFFARNAASTRELSAQGAAQETAQTAQNQAFTDMRAKQADAMSARDKVIASQNAQADAIREGADTQQAQLLTRTSGQALGDAQAADRTNRTEAFAPIAQNVQVSNPLGNEAVQGADTKQAFASRLAESAANIRSYGAKLAQVSSYTAPLTTVGEAISQEQQGIMPLAAANQLLQSGQSARILPSLTAYGIAGTEADAQKSGIGAALQGRLGVIQNQAAGEKGLADLQQGNTTTLAGNRAANAQSEAAAKQALGSLVSQVGNIGSYAAGRYGSQVNGYFGSGSTPGTAVGKTEPLTGLVSGGNRA